MIVLLAIISLFLISLVSANGLRVEYNNSIPVNKTLGIDKTIEITIFNDEPFEFRNISIDDDILIMNEVPSLKSGKNITSQLTIKTDEDFSGKIKVFGLFYSQLGQLNETHEVTVHYTEGLSVCDQTIVEGDSIKWVNLVYDDITLKNAETGESVYTVLEGDNYTKKFSNPSPFIYYFIRAGFPFTDTCKITVLDDEGWTNSPKYDAEFDLDVNIKRPKTSVTANFLNTDYTIEYNGEEDDLFSIQNNGNKTALVKFSADWISFSINNFELEAGKSKNVGYTIKPVIFKTNDTDKTHIKQLRISGNFETIIKNISVYIPYKNLGSSNFSLDYDPEVIKAIINAYCNENPDFRLCNPEIIYSNRSSNNMTIQQDRERFKAFMDHLISESDELRDFQNYVKLFNSNNLYMTIDNRLAIGNMSEDLFDFKSQFDSFKNSQYLLYFLIVFTLCAALIIYIFQQEKVKNKLLRFRSRWD
jgi:hypothetical protein